MVLIVTYDLHNPDRDYEKVEQVLMKARSWAHPQGSVWFIDTDREPSTWRDRLKAAGDRNDEFFVARLRRNWAATNTQDTDVTQWLKSSSRTW